jgi:alpha-L-rhamnosidase
MAPKASNALHRATGRTEFTRQMLAKDPSMQRLPILVSPVAMTHRDSILCRRRLFLAAFFFASSVAPLAPGAEARPGSELGIKTESAAVTPVQLRCEYAVDPLGIDGTHPRLFWQLASDARGQRQTAYQILAGSSLDRLRQDQGDLWDSGKVASDESVHIAYAGQPLGSSQQVFWKVRVWDRDGTVSPWSRPASWTMGVLGAGDWGASWIGARPGVSYETMLLRREFAVKRGLRRALAHVCGLGHYEMTLNGRKVGQDLLAPGWTKYDKTCLYDTHDIAPLLREGRNAVGILLGNGMYNVKGGRYTKFKGSFGPLKAIGQLRLEYDDGSMELVGTDDGWHASPGPITFSCVYGGEDYDARREAQGWDQAGFDDSRWEPTVRVGGPGGRLVGHSCAAPPIRVFDVLKPVSIKPLRPGVMVYDLGQNAALMPRIGVRGPAGAAVKITPAELVHADGRVDRGSCGGGEAYWKYTLDGRGHQTYFPKFFYHGCRYLEVECPAAANGQPAVVESLEGVVVHGSSPAAGEFACSNELFNRIRTLVRWSQRSNMMHVLTDCPHRERLGWLEEYHLNGPSLRYEFDLARLYAKGMNDMADSQLDSGLVPDIAPEYTVFPEGFRDSPEWGSAMVVVPWQQFEWTGDLELLRKHYQGMKRYVSYLESRSKGDIVSHGLGDWCDVGPNPPGYAQLTPPALTATAFFYLDAEILARTAQRLGQAEDAKRYKALAWRIRAAFQKAFFNSATNQFATGSQCANSMALVLGLAPRTSSVLDAIVADVRKRNNALTPGDVGYRYLLRALADGGRSAVIFDINNQSDKPGYGYQLNKGATSLIESWDARRDSSQNHFMLGHIVEWFYHDLAGIGCDPAGPGFKRILIRPQPVGNVTWVRAAYDSIHGRIDCHWKIIDGAFTLEATIPANTTATVSIPAKSPDSVTEGAAAADRSPGVRFVGYEAGRAIFEVGSGRYRFAAR